MLSLRNTAARRTSKILCTQCSKFASQPFTSRVSSPPIRPPLRPINFKIPSLRAYSTKSSADVIIEDLQDQYGTARDEFEIATEETEKKSVYAAGDREAAREELDRLKEMYNEALGGSDGEEIKRRIGQRIRELDHAVQALEKSALED